MSQAREPRERALKVAAIHGDADAWRDLFDSAFDAVANYIRWRCANRAELVEEVQQETWLTAAKRLRTFDPGKGAFAAWVCGVAANVARVAVRKHLRQKRRVVSLVSVPEPVGSASEETIDPERVALALAELPERYELALRMKYLQQWTVNEISAETGESTKAVESLLSRAREAFREAYLRLGGEPQ
jgi:RNA polymerase sigma-70 factor, ECF subfamily